MQHQLGDVLKAIGPNAVIVFAAWIFMNFLQARFEGAMSRYHVALGDYRANKQPDQRREDLRDEVLTYQRRCVLMARATAIGLTSAMLLIATLLAAGAEVLLPDIHAIAVAGTITCFLGFSLVIAAAATVFYEGLIVRRQIDDELSDLAELDTAVR